MVDENKVKVVCETDYQTKGCNETIDLDGRDSYQHEIILMADNNETKYTLNIQKNQTVNSNQTTNSNQTINSNENINPNQNINFNQSSNSIKNKELKITSIDGNPKEWTNKDVKIKVNASAKEGIDSYSFDGGITWQKENYQIISENKTLKIMVKDKAGQTTQSEEVKITKIDKEKPQVQLVKSSATNKEVTLTVSITDNLSGGEQISFNDGSYLKSKTYKARKEGTYSVKVKDKAGNVSDKSTISIQKSDFAESRGETKKTFTLTFDANGATISQNSVSCTTTGNSCQVTLPTITKNGAAIEGWGTSADSKTVQYKSGERVTISKNQKLYAITYKIFTATFNANGASSIGSKSSSCTAYNKNLSCNVTMPTITRSGGSVIGWNRTSSATKPTMKVGETLTLNANVIYYAITYKTLTATFSNASDTATKFSYSSDSCTIYNTTKSCSIQFPYVTRNGKTIMGFSTVKGDSNPPYTPTSTTGISKNTTFYVRTGTVRGSGITRNPYGTKNLTGIKNAPNKTIVIEYDKSCSSSVDSFVTALKNIYAKTPYIFRIHKVFLLNDSNYKATNSDSPNSSGVQHGIPQAQAIDIKCSDLSSYNDRESILVHELAHAMDGYYQIQNSSKKLMNSDFASLYNAYKNKSTFGDYSKTNQTEFFAEIYRYYYYTYLSSNNSYYKLSSYPKDVKKKLEQYINIAKSKW